ncbi:glycosyltransferase family 2 protein [Photobacterium carnosum]|uniref:glycosyltransferase family 2 protein n=1 Tax=Photobacterium carnosum TaxID=2023717 RepID=UPI001E33848E|nr:glycosyltransferase family 2 protein [Photobacterium carnosum]MCD9494948.1 glycosyltransferase [Photobacterium carnosum]
MKVSIIIGCYNVSKYLYDKKLSCILNQSYKNIEILLINDGSTDDTLSLCEKLALSDSRIKVFNKENGGLGSARNVGLDHASGDYIWFYDVDDEVELNLIEVCVDEINEKNHPDLIMFGFNVIDFKTKHKDIIQFPAVNIKNNSELKSQYLDLFVNVLHGNGFNWNKVYKRTLLDENEIRFGNNRIQQDEVFNVQVYPHVKTCQVLTDVLVDYYIYDSGNSRNRYIPNRFDIYKDVFDKLSSFNKEWLGDSVIYQERIDKKFVNSLSNIVSVDLFHPDCQLAIFEKINVIKKIYTQQYIINLMMKDKKSKSGIFSSIYQNLILYKQYFITYIFVFSYLKISGIKNG